MDRRRNAHFLGVLNNNLDALSAIESQDSVRREHATHLGTPHNSSLALEVLFRLVAMTGSMPDARQYLESVSEVVHDKICSARCVMRGDGGCKR